MMKVGCYILLILNAFIFSCQSKKVNPNNAFSANNGLFNLAYQFAQKVSDESVNIHSYDLFTSNYMDVQMLFETKALQNFSCFSNKISQTDVKPMNYEDCILFVATYDKVKNAKNVFQVLKSTSQIAISEVEGMAGIFVEQVQVFERIRRSGGMITQKGKCIFFLVKRCVEPPITESWRDYENLFVESITEKNEEVEVLFGDCEMEALTVQNRANEK